jgi:glc operon protein GlcG
MVRFTVAMLHMDAAAVPDGVNLAPGKARAALFRRSTSRFEAEIDRTRPAAVTARDFVIMTGGVPIVVDWQAVGAIGDCADIPEHDEIIAGQV